VFDEMDAHGEFQCGAHDDVDVVHGPGCQAGPVPFSRSEEVGVQAVEVLGSQ
jgi:hypothetical protein